jgi:hypothetical protein
MIQDLIRHMRRHSKPGHSRNAGSTKIMQPPCPHAGEFINLRFCPAKGTEGSGPGEGKHKFGRSRHAFEKGQRLGREVNNVWLGILGSGIRQELYLAVEVELIPHRPRSLFAALSRQS